MKRPKKAISFLLFLLLLIVITTWGRGQIKQAKATATTGQWTISNLTGVPDSSSLTAIATLSTNDVWSVGTAPGKGVLLEHYDGAVWTASTPFSQFRDAQGFTIGVVNASDIWIGGTTNDQNDFTSFLAHYDGSTWSRVTTPTIQSGGTAIRSMVVKSSTNIWAFGTEAGGNAKLVEHWDGTSWSDVTPTSIPQATGLLSSCLTYDGSMLVAGYTSGNSWLFRTDGTTWTINPQGGGGVDRLSCLPTSNDVYELNFIGTQYLVHFGSSTSNTVLANTGIGDIKAFAPNDVWIVGGVYNAQSQLLLTLTEYWDGKNITVVPSPSVAGASQSELQEVTGISSNDLWAIGYYVDAQNIYRPLVEHYVAQATPIKPSGLWVNPIKNGFSVTVGKQYTFKASAYPTKTGDPAIDHVNFTVTWPGHTGYVDICGNVTAHTAKNTYQCTTDFSKLNNGIPIPKGSLKVTFNVVDIKGNRNNASNGVRTGTISSPLLNVQYIDQFKSTGVPGRDCGPTSVAMALYFYHRIPTLDGNAIASIRQATGNTSGDTTTEQLDTALKSSSYNEPHIMLASTTGTNQEVTSMLTALKQGYVSVVLIDATVKGLNRSYSGHFFLLVGVSLDGKTVYVNDPDNEVSKPGINGGPDIALSMNVFKAAIDQGKSQDNQNNVIIVS